MNEFWKRHVADPPAASPEGTAPGPVTRVPPPAGRFRLMRHFSLASFAAFVLFAAALAYREHLKDDVFKQAQEDQGRVFATLQDGLVQRHDAAASAYLLRVYEAGNTNLGRLFSNAMWEQDFAPFVAKVQRISADRCRAIADARDGEKQDCHAGIGRQIMALPEFRALDARMFATMKQTTVLKIKVYDLRGLTVYSSEHRQIGEDAIGNKGWESAAAGRPVSELTRRDKFSAFEGELANRHLVSSYVPIYAPRTESIVGVLEIYSDVTPFLDQISATSLEIQKAIAGNRAQLERATAAIRDRVDADRNVLLAALFGTLALLYLALLLVVHNAQRILDARDIERKRAELTLARQKDLYDALSQTNKAIVHLTSREALFETVCRIAVEHGRFRFAWIGLIDQGDGRLKPAARHGEDAGYMDQLDIAGDGEAAHRRGLTGRMLLSGTPVISNDFLNDPAMAPWREAGRRAGVRASAKFPIRQGGAVIGAISLYAGETGFFTADLVATLEEMAADVSFALDNFQREAERKQWETALSAAEEKFRGLVEQSIAGTYIIQDGKFAYVNPRFAEIFGYGSAEEMIGRDPLSLVAEQDRDRVARNMLRRIEGDAASLSYDFAGVRRDGSIIDVGVHGARATHLGRPAVIGLIQDISEKKRAEEQIQRYVVQLEKAFMSTVGVATTLSEMRDPYTAGHERRVAEIAVAIGRELGFDERRLEGLRVAGYLHDVGKITIPSEILSRPGRLSPLELKMIQGHSQASYDVLKDVEFPWPVAQIALQHHERLDGSGYPQGLEGEAILLEARILAVADVVEAMSSHRPYRPGLGIGSALAEIERGRGTSYDANVADACLKLFREKGYAIPAADDNEVRSAASGR